MYMIPILLSHLCVFLIVHFTKVLICVVTVMRSSFECVAIIDNGSF